MPRVKRGVMHVKKRTKLLKKVKGYKWGRKNRLKLAKVAATKAGVHAYEGRIQKKRDMRALWQIKIGAFAKEHNLSYSKLIDLLKKANVELDRKILADMAVNNKRMLANIIEEVRK